MYAIVTVPASPEPTITLHNVVPLVFSNPVMAGWPLMNASYAATPSSCVMLEPVISNPAEICITSGLMTLNSPNAVGGLTELAAMPEDGDGVEATDSERAAGIAAALALFAAFGVMCAVLGGAAWRARRRLSR